MLKNLTAILVFGISVFFCSFTKAQVIPIYETDPVENWNGADDPAIWLNENNPDSSFFIGTDKSGLGRLELYNMDGSRFWSTPVGTSYNNVDVLYNYVLGEDTIDLVGACNKPETSLDFFKVDSETRTLVNISGNTNVNMSDMYGFSMYSDLCNDVFYSFLNRRTTDGKCYQYEMINTSEGLIDIELVRIISNLPSRTEGMIADPVLGHLYVSEESVGIWKYGSRPEDGLDRILMDSVSGPNLTALIEGLCIYYTGDSSGYLIASSQGGDDFQVYTREGDNTYLGTFTIDANEGEDIDAVSHADGIDVMNVPMGNDYPNGVFITHDLTNTGGNSNYKMVPWESIANALGLEINTAFNPLNIAPNLCDSVNNDTVSFVSNFAMQTLRIYPNPVTDWMSFDGIPQSLKGAELIVYNSLGSAVLRERFDHGQVNVSQLDKGFYILRIQDYSMTFIKD